MKSESKIFEILVTLYFFEKGLLIPLHPPLSKGGNFSPPFGYLFPVFRQAREVGRDLGSLFQTAKLVQIFLLWIPVFTGMKPCWSLCHSCGSRNPG
jgi:hypothetical protein